MLFESAFITAASGSVGNVTASRNRGGMYFRERVVPFDPSTPTQLLARAAMTSSVSAWATLTQADRDSWSNYAGRILFTGPLAGSVQLSGQQMFLRSKIAAAYVNAFEGSVLLSVPDSAPVGSVLPAFVLSPVLKLALVGPQTVQVTFDNTEPWASEVGSSMTISQGPAQGPGINFFRGPFRRAVNVFGSSAPPPSSPVIYTSPFLLAAGEKIWIRVRLFRVDGSLSSELIEGPVDVTP